MENDRQSALVWVFNGGGGFPGGVFSTRETVEAWIARHHLTGTLTAYPLDVGIYDLALQRGWFPPKREDQRTPGFIGRFSAAYQEHFHDDDGKNNAES